MSYSTFQRILFTAIVIFITLTSRAAGPQHIAFHGQVQVTAPDTARIVLTLTIEGQGTEDIPVAADGTFRVRVPEGSRAVLSFAQDAHITKWVLLDTQHAFDSSSNSGRNKRIAFDVILDRSNAPVAQAEQHLVGSIRFIRGSGLMKLHYEQEPVAWVSANELLATH